MGRVDWDRVVDRLGIVPDTELALELGVTRQRVHQVRSSMGIPSAPTPGEKISDVELSAMQDRQIADLHGVSIKVVYYQRSLRGIERPQQAPADTKTRKIQADPDLGRLPDTILAARYNTDASMVSQVRRALGTPVSPASTSRRGVVEWDSQDWGMSNADLAKLNGVSYSSVKYARARRARDNKHRPKAHKS